MSATYIRPLPSPSIPAELLEQGMADEIDEVIPSILGEAGILNSGVVLDITHSPGRAILLDGIPFLATRHENGMLEVLPIDEESGLARNLEDVDTARQTDPIIYMPQRTETLVVVANGADVAEKVICGIITMRKDETLYEPHFLMVCNLDPAS